MATETRLEALRPLYIALGMFALIAGMSFAWAAVESQQASTAPPRETQTAAAPAL